jgi:hypothetical protein
MPVDRGGTVGASVGSAVEEVIRRLAGYALGLKMGVDTVNLRKTMGSLVD